MTTASINSAIHERNDLTFEEFGFLCLLSELPHPDRERCALVDGLDMLKDFSCETLSLGSDEHVEGIINRLIKKGAIDISNDQFGSVIEISPKNKIDGFFSS